MHILGLRHGALRNRAGAGVLSPPADLITPQPVFAASTRKVRAAYAGSSIQLKRTDTTTTNVGFTAGGDFDSAAALAFAGTTGVAPIFYDQSTAGRNATEQSTGLSPQIVNGSAVENIAGKAAIKFVAASNLNYAFASAITGGVYTIICALYPILTGGAGSMTIMGGSAAAGAFQLRVNRNGSGVGTAELLKQATTSIVTSSNTITGTGPHIVYASGSGLGGVQTVGLDGTYTTASPAAQSYSQIDRLGAKGSTTSEVMDGWIGELLVYASVLSAADRDAVVGNMKSYWGTP